MKTRTCPVSEAIERSLASAKALQAAGARQLYFKYCSTFDVDGQSSIS
ncbi:MAG: four-carbon acid sugar kinase family protein [Hyphomicrobiaceae bacterium]